MQFTDEQAQFAREIRDFCSKELGTVAQRDALTDGGTRSNSRAVLTKLAELGWLGVSIPTAYGGAGAGFVDECIFLEESARGRAPITGYWTGLTAAQTYLRHGTEEQKQRILGGICQGTIEAIALSEPGAGSDLGSVRIKAERDGEQFVINGQKTWISAAHDAAHLLLLARTDPTGGKHEGLTLFIVATDAPGVEVRAIETMEAHTVNDVFFTDVRVPASDVVGQVGKAWQQMMRGLNVERLILSAMALGSAERALEDVVGYVKQREQFDRPISSFQAVRHRIADLATEIEFCRSFVYDVADKIDHGQEDQLAMESSMAKLKSTQVAKNTTLEAMQLMGGYGYAREYGMEGQVRRALAPPIYGGTNEIQREIISKQLGL
jgi:acyl-CoA dehydrogenase